MFDDIHSKSPSDDHAGVPLTAFMQALCDYSVAYPIVRHALTPLVQLDTPGTAELTFGSLQFLYSILTRFSVNSTVSWDHIVSATQAFRSSPSAHHCQSLLRQLNAPLGCCLSITDSVEAMIRRRCRGEASQGVHSLPPLTSVVYRGMPERSIQQVELSWSDGCVLFDVQRLQAVISEGLDPASGV